MPLVLYLLPPELLDEDGRLLELLRGDELLSLEIIGTFLGASLLIASALCTDLFTASAFA